MTELMSTVKQHAPSCERNKDFILNVLYEVLPTTGTVLEIGSGTGQHAAYFAAHLPHLIWQPSDLIENHASIHAWKEAADLPNLQSPVELDLFFDQWPAKDVTAIVCINTIHIVAWEGVKRLFLGAGRLLPPGGVMYVYGPYRYADRPLEPSNEGFDQWLKSRDPRSGVRNFEEVNALAEQTGLTLTGDRAMPANNRSIWWVKKQTVCGRSGI
jgi:cyclopropane fatty-acyl-phospholipid synthase-like methyltransferase